MKELGREKKPIWDSGLDERLSMERSMSLGNFLVYVQVTLPIWSWSPPAATIKPRKSASTAGWRWSSTICIGDIWCSRQVRVLVLALQPKRAPEWPQTTSVGPKNQSATEDVNNTCNNAAHFSYTCMHYRLQVRRLELCLANRTVGQFLTFMTARLFYCHSRQAAYIMYGNCTLHHVRPGVRAIRQSVIIKQPISYEMIARI